MHTGEVTNLSKQCLEWEKTFDAVQKTRVKEIFDFQKIISCKVCSGTSGLKIVYSLLV